MRRIQLVHGDTALTPYSTGTWGSRCAIMSGGAVATACERLAERVKRIGAQLLQARVEDVRLATARSSPRKGASRSARSPAPGIAGRRIFRADVDPGGLEVTAGYKAKRDTGTFSYAAHAGGRGGRH